MPGVRLDQTRDQPVRVDRPQGAKDVIGARDRAAGLDARMAVNQDPGNGPGQRAVTVLQRGQQQLGQRGVVQRAQRPAAATATAVLSGQQRPATAATAVTAVVSGQLRPGLLVFCRACGRGEVKVEYGVKGQLVLVALDERGPQCCLDSRAFVQREMPQGLHGIDVLADGHRHADLAQLGNHAFDRGEHWRLLTVPSRGRSRSISLGDG